MNPWTLTVPNLLPKAIIVCERFDGNEIQRKQLSAWEMLQYQGFDIRQLKPEVVNTNETDEAT